MRLFGGLCFGPVVFDAGGSCCECVVWGDCEALEVCDQGGCKGVDTVLAMLLWL